MSHKNYSGDNLSKVLLELCSLPNSVIGIIIEYGYEYYLHKVPLITNLRSITDISMSEFYKDNYISISKTHCIFNNIYTQMEVKKIKYSDDKNNYISCLDKNNDLLYVYKYNIDKKSHHMHILNIITGIIQIIDYDKVTLQEYYSCPLDSYVSEDKYMSNVTITKMYISNNFLCFCITPSNNAYVINMNKKICIKKFTDKYNTNSYCMLNDYLYVCFKGSKVNRIEKYNLNNLDDVKTIQYNPSDILRDNNFNFISIMSYPILINDGKFEIAIICRTKELCNRTLGKLDEGKIKSDDSLKYFDVKKILEEDRYIITINSDNLKIKNTSRINYILPDIRVNYLQYDSNNQIYYYKIDSTVFSSVRTYGMFIGQVY